MVYDKKIGALIVLYNPDRQSIAASLEALQPQVDVVCLIDNSKTNHSNWFASLPDTIYIPLGENTGIAKAQNAGINKLADSNCTHILFGDQDSCAKSDLVETLSSALDILKANGETVATVGSVAINSRTGKRYPLRSILKRHLEYENLSIDEVDYVRCSMSLTPIEAIKQNGLMDEELFIDGVDSEWCWRAFVKYGLRSYLVKNAIIYHNLGIADRHIINKEITIPATKRLYYQYRNYLILLRRNYVPMRWKIKNGVKYILKFPYYGMFCRPRLSNIRNMATGFVDGLKA